MNNRYQIIAVATLIGVVLIVGSVYFFIKPPEPPAPDSECPTPQPIVIEFWGVFDGPEVYQPLIRAYEDFYSKPPPEINLGEGVNTTFGEAKKCRLVNYRRIEFDRYEQELKNAFSVGRGPDVFMVNNTRVNQFRSRITPSPPAFFSPARIKNEYVPVVAQDFIFRNAVWGVPLFVDTLALFYNRDHFDQEFLSEPPKTWKEFFAFVQRLTRRDESGNIIRAGAAIGAAQNVNRAADILSLVMVQQGVDMIDASEGKAIFADPSTDVDGQSFIPGERALAFYTDFANPTKRVYTWNLSQDYSLDAFAEGRVSMMLSYSFHIPTIRAKNPRLNFAVAPVPQIRDALQANKIINYANYFGLTVSSSSDNPEVAWDFIRFLAQQDTNSYYLRVASRPAARIDLLKDQLSDPMLGVFALQAQTATSWPKGDSVEVDNILETAIDNVVRGQATPLSAIRRAADQITAVWQRSPL